MNMYQGYYSINISLSFQVNIKQMACSKHGGSCRNHTFEMRPIQGQGLAAPVVVMEFCPMASSSSQAVENIFPTFNRDGKYYTAGFILLYDQHYTQLNDTFEKDQFDRCVASKLAPSTNLFVPQPSSRYCHTCRTNYEDYLEHINADVHKANIQQSLGNRYLLELAETYREAPRAKAKKGGLPATEPLTKRTSTRIQEAYHRRKEKDQEVADVSTMTSQKNQKVEEPDRQVRNKTKRIHKLQVQPKRTIIY